MLDSRPGDRTPTGTHYTMMAPRQSPSGSHSHSHSLSHQSHPHPHPHSHSHVQSPRGKASNTPLASPRVPYSVGQNHPPKLSPGRQPQARSQSPNYFGLAVDPVNELRDSAGYGKDNWSPSTSSIKSFGAAIPKQVSLDANPEFEAFKRQADLNRGKSFALSTSTHHGGPSMSPAVRPRPPRWNTHSSGTPSENPFNRQFGALKDPRPASRTDADQDSLHDSAYVSSDSKRNSESSLHPTSITGMPRFESPTPMNPLQHHRTHLSRVEDRDPRLSMMERKADPPSPRMTDVNRAATLPPSFDPSQPAMITGQQLKDMITGAEEGELLVLDIRSSQNYARARVEGALNLCIPTTLLKRATFNIEKLQQTFSTGPDGDRFAKWREADAIVVYDAHSSDQRDAVAAQNMIKKFANEGYTGKTFILRGGFTIFQDTFPECVDERSMAEIAGAQGNKGVGGLAPVIGGVTLPTMGTDTNPFFSNIRQNMDLADGVGQFDIAQPSGLEPATLPQWLRDASAPPDHGKQVSNKFYNIERDEQMRMKQAYAAFDPKNGDPGNKVQLCGVEKGGKNRYKDILPFEHARVKLQSKPEGACDYINASHLRASRSNKRYIATQGPLPATFEDFWSVIWEQDVRVLVMLTAESEGGQLKCHPYWKGRDHGAIRLMPLSEKKASLDIDKHRADSTHTPSAAAMGETGRRRANTTTTLETSTPTPHAGQAPPSTEAPYVIIRKFALSHAAHPFAPIREITHLHFPAWPDFGTPAQPSHLLALIELANVMQRASLPVDSASIVESRKRSLSNGIQIRWYDEPEADARARPMLVHCSAGCGRTGTFCTVDSVLDMMKRQRQATTTGTGAQDAEGDVPMTDDDAVSPLTNKAKSFNTMQHRQSSMSKTANPAVPIDTAWLQDDKVDLIQRTVEDFRGQRLSMVQSLRQFVLCYETVLEWINRMNERGSGVPGRARSGSLQAALRDT